MGASTQSSFVTTVQGALVREATNQVTGMTGPINLSTLQNTIAGQVMGATGLGSVNSIVSSFGSGMTSQFTDLVKGSAVNSIMSGISGFTGNLNLESVKSLVGNSILGTTGLGSLSNITGALGTLTSGSFSGLVKNGIVNSAVGALSGLSGDLSVDSIKSTIAESVLGTTGLSSLGSVADIAGGLTSVTDNAVGDLLGSTTGGLLGGLTGGGTQMEINEDLAGDECPDDYIYVFDLLRTDFRKLPPPLVPGNWALGLAGDDVACEIYTGTSCVEIGEWPLMKMVGTSIGSNYTGNMTTIGGVPEGGSTTGGGLLGSGTTGGGTTGGGAGSGVNFGGGTSGGPSCGSGATPIQNADGTWSCMF
jgi:hypothetical protein